MQLAKRSEAEKLTIATAFDVTWAVLLALKEVSKNYSLESNAEKSKEDKAVTKYLNDMLKSSNFEGLTVRCSAIVHILYLTGVKLLTN